MVFLTVSKKLNQYLGPYLLRRGVKLRYNFARGILNDNPTADALVLLPWAQKLIEIETYEAMQGEQQSPTARAAILESYIRPALVPTEQWADVQRWQFHLRLQKWLRAQFLIARHPVPSLPKSVRQSPQLQPQFNQAPNNIAASRLPLTATVTRTFSMLEWPTTKAKLQRSTMTSIAAEKLPTSRIVRLRGGAVCFVYCEEPSTTTTAGLDLEELLEVAGCHVAACGPFNTLCEELDIYQLWTREYVERLAHYLWQSCSTDQEQETVILDVGAGDGLLAHLLRQQLQEASQSSSSRKPPPTVIASDDGSWKIGQLAEVKPWSVQETMERFRERKDQRVIVLCSWMPANEDWTQLFRDAGVDEYILIGECDDGQCGDNWETWGNYESLLVEETPAPTTKPPLIPQYDLDHYERKEISILAPYQLSRFDSAESRAGRTISFRKKNR